MVQWTCSLPPSLLGRLSKHTHMYMHTHAMSRMHTHTHTHTGRYLKPSTWLLCGTYRVCLSVRTTGMEWGRKTFGRQLVSTSMPEETIFLAYGYVDWKVHLRLMLASFFNPTVLLVTESWAWLNKAKIRLYPCSQEVRVYVSAMEDR